MNIFTYPLNSHVLATCIYNRTQTLSSLFLLVLLHPLVELEEKLWSSNSHYTLLIYIHKTQHMERERLYSQHHNQVLQEEQRAVAAAAAAANATNAAAGSSRAVEDKKE